MKSSLKKLTHAISYVLLVASIGICIIIPTRSSYAQNPPNQVTVESYQSVVDDPCKGKDCYTLFSGFADALGNRFESIQNVDSLGGFINAVIAFGIGLGGVIAIAMIMYQGFLYMRTDSVTTKSRSKGIIINTLVGFVLLLSIYTLLRTINPDLLNLTPRIQSADFLTGGDSENIDSGTATNQYANFKAFAATHNIPCTGSGGAGQIPAVAQAMQGKITYSMEKRGQACANDTFCLDCSGFVNAVYSCVGIASPGYTTSSIFSNGAATINSKTDATVNGKTLTSGDLLGWVKGSITGKKQESFGHVIMYIGNGKTIESTGADKSPGNAIFIRNTTAYGPRLKSLKDLP